MSERSKIHVFLGAPPPSSDAAPPPGAGLEDEERPRQSWRHLDLTWQNRRLRPATASGESDWLDLQSQEDESNTDQGDLRSDWTKAESHGRKRLSSLDDEESHPGPGDECSLSVHEYLDFCFPAAQPEPETEPPESRLGSAAPPLSNQTQYLTTRTLSQAAVLRGIQSGTSRPHTPPKAAPTPTSDSSSTPELFSPIPPSLATSLELFSQPCVTPRMKEGGVIIEANEDGVLCSQEGRRESLVVPTSSSKSPDFKKPRISENLTTEASEAPTDGAKLRRLNTPLIHCTQQEVRYSVLVAVVHPCHLREVKVKTGPAAGTSVPLASIVVTDQSGVEMKVVLWRRAAFWVLTVGPGDILLITGLRVNEDRWRGETVLQSTFSTKLLNLGQVTSCTSPPAPKNVDARSLHSLCVFLRDRRPSLATLNRHAPQDLSRLPYAALRSLRVNTLVHALLRVTHTHVSTEWRSQAESRCSSAVQLKAVLTVEQPNNQQGALLLWGSAVEWLPRFKRDKGAVWDFHVLLVRDGLTFDLPELHSTPWSSVQPLDPASRRAKEFFQLRPSWTGSTSIELDLETLLSQKYSGEVDLGVQINTFHFQDSLPSQNALQSVLDSFTSLDGIIAALSGDVTYTGCGRCATELDTDDNDIYRPCYPCLPHTAVRRYYRPGVLTVSGRGDSQVCVQVPPVPLHKILGAPPDKLHRSSAPGSEVKHIQVAARRIQTLLSLPRQTFTISLRSHFLCDGNGVSIHQDFTLLDLQFPTDGHPDQTQASSAWGR